MSLIWAARHGSNRQAFAGARHIVLTRDLNWQAEGTVVVRNFESALAAAKAWIAEKPEMRKSYSVWRRRDLSDGAGLLPPNRFDD